MTFRLGFLKKYATILYLTVMKILNFVNAALSKACLPQVVNNKSKI